MELIVCDAEVLVEDVEVALLVVLRAAELEEVPLAVGLEAVDGDEEEPSEEEPSPHALRPRVAAEPRVRKAKESLRVSIKQD